MAKLTGVSDGANQASKMISVRIDPKIRYLAELAAEARNESLTKYLEWALDESFKKVTLYKSPELEITYGPGRGEIELGPAPDPEEEQAKRDAMLISNKADLLWNENEYVRMAILSSIAPHLVPEEDALFLKYMRESKDLQVKSDDGTFKLDREKIHREWTSIRAAFLKTRAGEVK